MTPDIPTPVDPARKWLWWAGCAKVEALRGYNHLAAHTLGLFSEGLVEYIGARWSRAGDLLRIVVGREDAGSALRDYAAKLLEEIESRETLRTIAAQGAA